MGELNSFIRLYRSMRLALLVSVPMAASLIFYVITEIPIVSIVAFATAVLCVLEETPEPKEIRRSLRQKEFRNDKLIWYMIEDRETGDTRVM